MSASTLTRKIESFALLSERDKVKRIIAVIRFAERKLRYRFPILQHQNMLGALIFSVSVLGFVTNAVLYVKDIIPGWWCFLSNAFFASLLHELEHDIIHHLYFRAKPIVQNFIMWGIWIFRGNLISPWYRRIIHQLHHRESGLSSDIEERLIGNGMPLGFKRVLIMLDTFWSQLRFREFMREIPQFSLLEILKATFPMFIIFNVIWLSFLTQQWWSLTEGFHNISSPFPDWYVNFVNLMMVIYVGPNILRQACLSIISSYCHYYGNIAKSDVLRQTQVLQPWYLWPLQLFCFNFGGTHCIHHFVVNQPFYIRQMVAPMAHAAMKKYGVRFNDTNSILRANNYLY